jgi:hypothetical protein
VKPRTRKAPPKPAAACYLYAVVASAAEPAASGAPDGPPGLGGLRWLSVGNGLWLAAADAPLPRYGSTAIE